MIYEDFKEEWAVFCANFSRAASEKQTERVYELVRDIELPTFHARCSALMDLLLEWPKNLTSAFAKHKVHAPCQYHTHDRPCGLAGCVSENLDGGGWYCPYHIARMRLPAMSDEAEYAWFETWCAEGRWPICTTDRSLLWRILCGLNPASAPSGSFTPILPWQGVIDGSMTQAAYWRGRKAPFECTKEEITALYGPSPAGLKVYGDTGEILYRCSRVGCTGDQTGCRQAPKGCAADAGWQAPEYRRRELLAALLKKHAVPEGSPT